MGIRIVVTSDNHLHRYYAKMNPHQLHTRWAKLRDAFKATVDFAIEQKVQLYFQLGDLFDVPEPRNAELVFVAAQLRRLNENEVQVFLISGTHDTPKVRTLAEATSQHIFQALGGVNFFPDKAAVKAKTVNLDGLKVAIGGLSTDPHLRWTQDPLENAKFPARADVNILLLHYLIEEHYTFKTTEPIIRISSIEKLGGVNYIFCGHLHEPDVFTIADKHIIMTGATERLDFGEIGNPTGFYYLELEEKGPVNVEYVEITPQPMSQINIAVFEIPTDNATEFIINKILESSQPDQLLKCRITGDISRELFRQIGFEDIWRVGRNQNFYFDLETELEVESEEWVITLGATFSQREEIEQVAKAQMDQIEDQAEKEVIQEALNLILSKLDRGK